MGLISSLYRAEEVIVPNWPFELMRTATPSDEVAPKILPIKHVLFTFAPATPAPMQITLLAVVTLSPASSPIAVLLLPVVLLRNALRPTAVFPRPPVKRKMIKQLAPVTGETKTFHWLLFAKLITNLS